MEENRKNALNSVHIELTRLCNLRCRYCLVGHDNVTIEKKRLLRLFDELVKLGVFRITLTGGEPFILEDLFYFVEQARDRGFRVGILTNGTLISRKLARKISDYNIDIRMSLYGASEETYRNLTGKKAFKKAFGGIKNLAEAGVHFSLSYIINTINYKDIPTVKEIFGNMNNIKLEFRSSVVPNRDGNFSLLKYELHAGKLHRILKQYDIGIKEYASFPDKRSQLTEPTICGSGINKCYIAADGMVLPCATYVKEAGNIYKEPLEKIWKESALFGKLRKLKVEDFNDCKTCNFKTICRFRCLAIFEMMEGKPTKCPEYIYLKAKNYNNYLKGGYDG